MKKSITRIISLSLAILMVLSLAACGKKPTPGGSSTPGTTSSTPSGASSSKPADPGLEATRGKIDPKQELNADGTKKKLVLGIQQEANVLDYENNAFIKYMEERMNIDIDIMLFASDNNTRAQQVNTMLAANEALPDIMFRCFYNKADQKIMGDDGYFIDLAPYFDNPNEWPLGVEYDIQGIYDAFNANKDDAAALSATLNAYRTPDGAMYAWPGTLGGGEKGIDSIYNQMWINKVWLDNLGLQKPTNWDELLTVLRAFRDKDPNKNGKADELPMSGFSTHVYGNTLAWILNMDGAKYNMVVNDNGWLGVKDDGTVFNPYTDPGYREGLKRMRQLYEEKLLDPSVFTITKNDVKAYFTPASGQALVGIMSGHATAHTDRSTTEVMMEYEALPLFDTATQPFAEKAGSRYYFITDGCKDFDLACEFLLQWAWSPNVYGLEEDGKILPEVYYRAQYGTPGEYWNYCTDYDLGVKLPEKVEGKESATSAQTKVTLGLSVGPSFGFKVDKERHPFQSGSSKADPVVTPMSQHVSEQRAIMVEKYYEVSNKNNPTYANMKEPPFTDTELEEVGTSYADIKAYAVEYRTKFTSGELDINDDKAWNAYVAGFEALGESTLLKNAQAAFDRTYRK